MAEHKFLRIYLESRSPNSGIYLSKLEICGNCNTLRENTELGYITIYEINKDGTCPGNTIIENKNEVCEIHQCPPFVCKDNHCAKCNTSMSNLGGILLKICPDCLPDFDFEKWRKEH